MSNAEDWYSTHGASWTAPSNIQAVSVVGWGIATPRGINYDEAHGVLDPQPLGLSDTKMIEGDGTVIYLSANAVAGTTYWVNIRDYNSGFTKNREHKNILEIDPLRTLITNIITDSNTELPSFITYAKPTADSETQLNIGVHSPVTLHLYDSSGRHTGPISNPDPSSDLDLYEEQIPNSYYWRLGEGQYAGTDAIPTTMVLKGTETGTMSVELHNVIGTNASTTIFDDIPVTASTTATLETGAAIQSLVVDINGDGATDAVIAPGAGITADELVALLQGLADSLNLPAKKDKKLDKKIAKLQKVLDKEYKNEKKQKQKLSTLITTIENQITKWQQKGLLTADEATSLIALLGQIKTAAINN